MLVKLLDLFVCKKAQKDPNLLFKFRFLAAIMLLFSVLDAIAISFTYIKIIHNPTSFVIYGFFVLSVFLALKLSENINLVSFLFVSFCFWLCLTIINVSGGIYSYNLKWLLLIVLFGIIFNYKPNNKMPFIYLIVALIANFYFYFIETSSSRNDFDRFLELSKIDFLVENIIHLLAFSAIIFFYYVLHNRLLIEINKKNEVLENQYKLNLTKTKELNKIKEKLEETNRNLKSYAHATSHDLKEPLRTITSFTQLLKRELSETDLSPKAEEYLNYVELGGSRMYHLVEDALILSKVNKLTIGSFEQFDINKVLAEVLADLTNQINESKATILYKNLPYLLGNRLEIKRLFQNLISNSINYARENVPPLISISYELKNNEQIFSIADNGKGIDPKDLKKIFEPYKRMNTKKEGTGFGLAICKKIVELHQGNIWAESLGNSGTLFKFSIPVT